MEGLHDQPLCRALEELQRHRRLSALRWADSASHNPQSPDTQRRWGVSRILRQAIAKHSKGSVLAITFVALTLVLKVLPLKKLYLCLFQYLCKPHYYSGLFYLVYLMAQERQTKCFCMQKNMVRNPEMSLTCSIFISLPVPFLKVGNFCFLFLCDAIFIYVIFLTADIRLFLEVRGRIFVVFLYGIYEDQ